MREHCLAFFRAGLIAADPATAVQNHLRIIDNRFQVATDSDGHTTRTGDWSKIHIVAFGKAAPAMAKTARLFVPPEKFAAPGIVVTTYDNVQGIDGFEVFGAGHPLPDINGMRAAQKLADKVRQAEQQDLILALISGGGSALLPFPVEGVSLDDKIATTQLLLGCGANINQINCVRKHLSQIKGGGLARLTAPAELHALILSDVLGDDFSSIASGPTVADPSTFAEALDILESNGISEQVPASVKAYLELGKLGRKPETAKPGDSLFGRVSHTLVGSNTVSVDAVAEAAASQHYRVQIFSNRLSGEARDVADRLLQHAKQLFRQGIRQNTALIAGGETTVTLRGDGRGGRNQEMALSFALAAEKYDLSNHWTFLSGGTDGRDGPTDAAGGLVNSQTLSKIRAAGIDPSASLDNNDSYTALQAANDLVITGATGTNVADLQILLLHPFND
ncbi:MAG: glycerate kinase type-2 family protein [Gammaproteobacteria bacterium]